jgi:hypothetical protein
VSSPRSSTCRPSPTPPTPPTTALAELNRKVDALPTAINRAAKTTTGRKSAAVKKTTTTEEN